MVLYCAPFLFGIKLIWTKVEKAKWMIYICMDIGELAATDKT